MKHVLLVLGLLISMTGWSQIVIAPLKSGQTIYPGDVIEATAQILDDSLVNGLRPEVWRKMGTPQTFLFMGFSPIEKDATGWHLQLKIVLGPNFSPDKTYPLVLSDRTVDVSFKGWMWSAQGQQIAPEYDYEDIPLFSRSWFQKHWMLTSLLALFLVGVAGYFTQRWVHTKKKMQVRKAEIATWLTKISDAQTVHHFSLLWSKRDELLRIFPNHEEDFRKLFDRLNQCQFKPKASIEEVDAVKKERNALLEKIRGGSHGA